ncbi:MAG: PAS domain S-box protein [Acidobacteriia bacterium]|nr:PAS domain S-box protein [Terriglobia bacterium]
MREFLTELFSSDFMPHGYCYLWRPEIVWLHAISDALIGLAYYCIPLVLAYLVRRRRDLPFHGMFLMFGVFIFGCGTTHLMEVWTIWHGTYWLAGVIKAVTAGASVATAAFLVLLVPRALALPSPEQLRAANMELEREICERRRAEEAVRASEERWRAIFENSAVGIVVTNPQGAFTATNRAYQQMVGYSDDELRGVSYPDITYEEDRATNHVLATTLWEGKLQQFTLEKRYRRKDGRLIWVRSTVSLALGSETVPPFGMAIIEDITERKQAEEAMRRSQMMFEKLFDSSPDAIVASDRQGRIARVSEQVEKIFGYTRSELLGQPVEVLVPEVFRRAHSADREDYYAQPRVRPMGAGLELHGRRKDGTEFPVDILLSLIETEEGPLVLSVVRDITERKQAEERLRRSEAHLAEAQRLSHIGSWAVTITPPRKLLFWSEENYRICGFDPANGTPSLRAVVGRIHPEDHAKGDEAVRAAIRERRDFVFDFRIVLPDGTTKFCHSIGHPVVNQTGDVVEFTGTVMDVTESKRSEEALQRSFDQLRALTAQLQSVREEERTMVAREIHDELGQALTAIKLDVTALVRELPADQGPAVQRGQSILKLLDETIQSVQRISTDLRPGILDDLGLAAAVEWAAEEFEARTGTKCRVRMPDEDINIDSDRATALFRIFQETLTNVARHAKATEVNVRLEKENDDLVLEVHDNGLGIREEQLSAGRSLGILGMRERALLLGGGFIIQGDPGGGTTVRVRIPRLEPQKNGTAK